MRDNLVIEKACISDLVHLADVERSASRKFSEYLKIESDIFSQTLDQRILRQSLESGSLLVAREDGMIVGFLAARLFDNKIHIDEISVKFDFQGKGIGKELLYALSTESKKKNIEAITLTTDKLIPWNYPLYSKLGYKEISLENCPPYLEKILQKDRTENPIPENRISMIKYI